MKTAAFPSVRVDPDLRQAAEDVLNQGESLSSFVEQSIRENIGFRLAQREFISRGLASRDRALKTGNYVSSKIVIGKLEKKLAKAITSAAKSVAARG